VGSAIGARSEWLRVDTKDEQRGYNRQRGWDAPNIPSTATTSTNRISYSASVPRRFLKLSPARWRGFLLSAIARAMSAGKIEIEIEGDVTGAS
jgi:hypothetical protein